jgi:CRP-like cAMP-binding protein
MVGGQGHAALRARSVHRRDAAPLSSERQGCALASVAVVDGYRADRRRGTMRTMIDRDELLDAIAGFGLFADLTAPQLEAIIHIFDERVFAEGEIVVHQGLSGSAFYIIVDGEAQVLVDGVERAKLGRGDFFGEVAILLGVPATADVKATRQLRCLVLAGPRVEPFLVANPKVMFRMLQASARRLRTANRWGS